MVAGTPGAFPFPGAVVRRIELLMNKGSTASGVMAVTRESADGFLCEQMRAESESEQETAARANQHEIPPPASVMRV